MRTVLLLASVASGAALAVPPTEARFDEHTWDYAPSPQVAAADLRPPAHAPLRAAVADGDPEIITVMDNEAALHRRFAAAARRHSSTGLDMSHLRRRLSDVLTRISDTIGPAPKDDEDAIDLIEDLLSGVVHVAKDVVSNAAMVFADAQLPKRR